MANNEKDTPPKPNAALSISKLVVYGVYVVAIYIEVLLLLRVVLLFFSANPDTPFTQFVYTNSSYFIVPFRGIFPAHPSALTGGYLDLSALVAAAVYLIVLAAIQSLLAYMDRRR